MHKTREIVISEKLLSTGFVIRIEKIWPLFVAGFSQFGLDFNMVLGLIALQCGVTYLYLESS